VLSTFVARDVGSGDEATREKEDEDKEERKGEGEIMCHPKELVLGFVCLWVCMQRP